MQGVLACLLVCLSGATQNYSLSRHSSNSSMSSSGNVLLVGGSGGGVVMLPRLAASLWAWRGGVVWRGEGGGVMGRMR